MKFNKSLISLSLIATLSACGGSSSSKAKIEPAPVPVTTAIDGKAIKGTFANAIITVFKFENGIPVQLTTAELGTSDTVTGPDGNYSITVNDYDGPIKVELSVGDATTMICDAPAGCGGVAFGEMIDLSTIDPNFTLSGISTVSSDSGGAVSLNVSALTHLAAELIEAKAAENGSVDAALVQEKSSAIANAFGITGSITELEPTVVENVVLVAGEDNPDELRYGLINSGVMSAIFSGVSGDEANADGFLSGRLAEVALDIVASEGALLANQDDDDGFELALVDVLSGAGEAAANLSDLFAADDSITPPEGVDLEQLETNLENAAAYADANAGDDGRVDVVTEVPTTGDEVAKAKAMLQDVKLFKDLFDVTKNQDVVTQGDAYIALIDDASVMIETEAASFMLLAEISDALSTISNGQDDGTITATTFDAADYITGATGSITHNMETDAGDAEFNINITKGNEVVTLTSAVTFADDGLSITLSFAGTIESTGATFTLSEGSFAKVNLDSAATRASLEDDTYEGEVTSGELELMVSIAQKETDTVTNPVTFTGVVKTKLLPVIAHTLDEKTEWARDENGDLYRNDDGTLVIDENGNIIREFDRYGKSIETQILPEMLSLSGGFSSLSGDLIKATLTVNIQDLESYEAPEFKYIGAPVGEAITVTVSEDKNTIVIATSEEITDGRIQTSVFTPGVAAGEWSRTTTTVWDDSTDKADEAVTFSRELTTTNGMTGYNYNYSYSNVNGGASVYIEIIIPTDTDNDGIADYYTYNGWNGSSWDDEGNLLSWNGDIIELTAENSWGTTINEDVTEIFKTHALQGDDITNGAQEFAYMAQWFYRGYEVFTLASGTRLEVLFSENEDNLAVIADGTSGSLTANVSADLLIEDAFTIVVSEDSNTVIAQDDANTRTYLFEDTGAGDFVFNREVASANGDNFSDIRKIATTDVGLDIEEVTISRRVLGEWNDFHQFVRITPIDDNDDGVADYFTQVFNHSKYINSDGVLVDESGAILAEYPQYAFDTWDNAYFSFNGIPFNPFTTTNALEAYKQWLVNARGSYLFTYVDDIGSLETKVSSDEIDLLIAGSSNSFDAINTRADSNESLENEDVFLDANAAIALEVVLGEYQVNLTLSGERTALDDGKFDLAMSYKLPDDTEQRSFVVHANTAEEGTFSANNSEGVLLVLKELPEGSQSNVIGTIVVGSAAVEAAKIEDRGNGLIMIVYSNGESESL